MEALQKVSAWFAGIFGGHKAAVAVDNSAAAADTSTLITNGLLAALSTAKNINPSEQAVVSDVLNGVSLASDIPTYVNGLTSAIASIPAGQLSPTTTSLLNFGIDVAAATALAAHPAPASVVAPAAS